MKTITNKAKTRTMHAALALFAALTVTVALFVAAAPAMAGPRLGDETLGKTHDRVYRIHEVSDSLNLSDLIFELDAVGARGEGPFPDGGGWEPVFPEDPAPIPDAGDWEPGHPEDPAPIPDGGDWEPVFPEGTEDDAAPTEDADETGDDVSEDEAIDDEAIEEEAANEDAAEDDESMALPFTGGNSTPWLIAGAIVVGAGIGVLCCRRPRNETR